MPAGNDKVFFFIEIYIDDMDKLAADVGHDDVEQALVSRVKDQH
jgi:hypothetical protein